MADALDQVPEALAELIDNVVVLVEDRHPTEDLLGLYDGVPLTERDDYGGLVMPDRITDLPAADLRDVRARWTTWSRRSWSPSCTSSRTTSASTTTSCTAWAGTEPPPGEPAAASSLTTVPFDASNLHRDEQIVLDLHPHWIMLVKGVVILVVTIALGIWVLTWDLTRHHRTGRQGRSPASPSSPASLYMLQRWIAWISTNFVVTTDRCDLPRGHRVQARASRSRWSGSTPCSSTRASSTA